MHLTVTPHVATAVALVGAGIIATTPATAPPPEVHPMKVATAQEVDLLSLSSALAGLVGGVQATVDAGAASLETGLEQTWTTQYLAVKGLINNAQNINTALTAAVTSVAGTVPVVGPFLVSVINTPGAVVPQGLTALDVVYRIGTQLAFGAVEFVPIEAANLTDFAAKTVISVLNAVPAPLAVASTTSAPLKASAVTTTATTATTDTDTDAADSVDTGTAPVVKPARTAKAASAAVSAANKAISHAVSSALGALHKPPKKATSTQTPKAASGTESSDDSKSADSGHSADASK